MTAPRYRHDRCPHCVFQGQLDDEDIWTCRDTVMRRYGKGSAYESSLTFLLRQHAILDPGWGKTREWLKDRMGPEWQA